MKMWKTMTVQNTKSSFKQLACWAEPFCRTQFPFYTSTTCCHSLLLIFNHTLCRILESRIEALLNMLPIMQQRAMNINEAATLDNVFEDVHWAVLIAGHVLCMESDGETALIPSEVTLHSTEMAKRGVSNAAASIKALDSTDVSKILAPQDLEQCDHVIRVGYNVMRLCSVEELAISMKLGHFLSPEVGSTLMWFLKRWCMSYLLPNEDYYHQV